VYVKKNKQTKNEVKRGMLKVYETKKVFFWICVETKPKAQMQAMEEFCFLGEMD